MAIGLGPFVLACGLLVATDAIYMLEYGAGPDDARTYFAAGERLDAGHELYSLRPEDRVVPPELLGPGSTVPLLSPPLVAVPWRALALLPESVALATWWCLMTALIAWTLLVLVRAGALTGGLAAALAAMPLVWQIAGANVNAMLIAGATCAWIAWARGRTTVAGAILGALVIVKIEPLPLAVWAVACGGWPGLRGVVAGALAAGLVSLLGAGVGSHVAYIGVVVDAASRSSELSLGTDLPRRPNTSFFGPSRQDGTLTKEPVLDQP
jgi:Glycosyltransferase family 87